MRERYSPKLGSVVSHMFPTPLALAFVVGRCNCDIPCRLSLARYSPRHRWGDRSGEKSPHESPDQKPKKSMGRSIGRKSPHESPDHNRISYSTPTTDALPSSSVVATVISSCILLVAHRRINYYRRHLSLTVICFLFVPVPVRPS